MLQFYYQCIDKYLLYKDFECCAMDMDSAYIAISGNRIEDLIKPEL